MAQTVPTSDGALEHVHDVMRGDADVGAELRQQVQRDDQPFADDRAGVLRHAIDVDQCVVEVGARGDRAVAGHGPRRGRPDHQRCTAPAAPAGARTTGSAPRSCARVVVVLHLRLGQRGLFHRRPQHRAQAAIQRAVQQELADLVRRSRLRTDGPSWRSVRARRPRRRGGGTRPSARAIQCSAQARHSARNCSTGTASLSLLSCAVAFLDLPLDRQAVAVPAGDVVGVVAGHLAGAVDDVLVDLVQRGADVDVAVRVRAGRHAG